VLLLSLFLLWFSSSDEFFLCLNIKLVGCSVRFFFYVVHFWKNQMMFMTLIIGNFLLIVIPSSNLISISLQTALFHILVQFAEDFLYWLFHGTMISRFKEADGALLPFVMGNYFFKNQCLSLSNGYFSHTSKIVEIKNIFFFLDNDYNFDIISFVFLSCWHF
jgi:hypothetical protein